MGDVVHEALLITSGNKTRLATARNYALQLFDKCLVSNMSRGMVNDYRTFVIWPSGSKIGWAVADKHSEDIAKMINWLETEGPNGNYCEWKHVRYGSDLERGGSK